MTLLCRAGSFQFSLTKAIPEHFQLFMYGGLHTSKQMPTPARLGFGCTLAGWLLLLASDVLVKDILARNEPFHCIRNDFGRQSTISFLTRNHHEQGGAPCTTWEPGLSSTRAIRVGAKLVGAKLAWLSLPFAKQSVRPLWCRDDVILSELEPPAKWTCESP